MADKITLGHGSGGKLSAELIRGFLKPLGNPILNQLADSAVFSLCGKVAFTTDSFVVHPLFFPGGDIGSLSVSGTINDLVSVGAVPRYLSLALIIEEDFSQANLKKIIASAARTAAQANVKIVTGDTKVVNRGRAHGLFVTTSGCGLVPDNIVLGRNKIKIGDVALVNGPVGDHAAAVMLARNEFSFSGKVKSDAVPLNGLVNRFLPQIKTVRFIRDITRGGLATILSEVSEGMNWGIEISETAIPMRREVIGIAGILGLDPLYFACEGRIVVFVAKEEAERMLSLMQKHPLGKGAAIIGKVVAKPAGRTILRTRISGTRLLEPFSGDQLPRIC
ncbi:MAG: hydrogenase expression/formation protein HypE [Candidatus Omnitrophica bacterium]|nr:hydrogenase expression/formation protein HypE [Candidatus Omnitrophota bacterium]